MYENVKISEPMRKQLDSELVDGESVEWMGQPQFNFFMPTSIIGLLVGLLLIGLTIFIGYEVYESSRDDSIRIRWAWTILACLLPGVMGLCMAFNPVQLWWKARQRLYVITNARVILFAGSREILIRSFLPEELMDISCTTKANGLGDITLSKEPIEENGFRYLSVMPGFERISMPREVEQLLKELAAKSDTKTAVQPTQNRSHIQVL